MKVESVIFEHSNNMTDTEEAHAAASTSITSITPTDKDATKSKLPSLPYTAQILSVFIVFSLRSAKCHWECAYYKETYMDRGP